MYILNNLGLTLAAYTEPNLSMFVLGYIVIDKIKFGMEHFVRLIR